LPRGFLFSVINNPVSIHLTKNDTLRENPISRIRYYQAANNEAFIDAMFSAKVLSRLAILFRVTNINAGDRYENSEYNSWKANFKTTYKFSDNYYTYFDYNYLDSRTKLNGGVDINSILANTNDYKSILYNTTFAPIYFNNRYLNSTTHNLQLSLISNVFRKYFSKIIFGYKNNLDEFRQNIDKPIADSTRIYNNNKSSLYSMQLEQEMNIGKFNSIFSARYERAEFDVPFISKVNKQTNYYAWTLLNYNFLDGKIKPSVYAKYLNYGKESENGFGLDITTHPLSMVDFYIGFSTFGKPYSILERYTLPTEHLIKDQTISTFMTSVKLNYLFTETSISYFESKHNNTPIPIFISSLNNIYTSHITYTFTDNILNKGVNITSENKIGVFLTSINFNYYLNSNSQFVNTPEYSLLTGIYYADTLFNSNLNLKTGFTFYLNSEVNFKVYDFQRGQSAELYLKDNVAQPFTTLPSNNSNNRLDFFLAGRIQDKATFYFTFENLLDNKYYIVPFYPMHPRGVRIGLSWDFIN